ncbi:MAG: FAD-dependent oxidoreductase, partial [Myxococcota bacterium]
GKTELAPTWLDGIRLAEPQTLVHGSAIRIGTTLLGFSASEDSRSSGATAATVVAHHHEVVVFGLPDGTTLTSSTLSVGSRAESDLFIEDREVRPDHLRIVQAAHPSGELGFELEDRSGGGTRLNGRVVTRVWLDNGDVVRIGHHELVIRVQEGRCVLTVRQVNLDPLLPRAVVAGAGSTHTIQQSLAGLRASEAPSFSVQASRTGNHTSTLHINKPLATLFSNQVVPAMDRLAVLWKPPWDIGERGRAPRLALLAFGLAAIVFAALALGWQDELTGRGVSPPHHNAKAQGPEEGCARCHQRESAPTARAALDGPWMRDACLTCHTDDDPSPNNLTARPRALRRAHSREPELGSCTGCHTEHASGRGRTSLISDRCADCHADRHRSLAAGPAGPHTETAPDDKRTRYSFYADLGDEVGQVELHRAHSALEYRCRSCHELASGEARPEDQLYGACAQCHGGPEAFAAALASPGCADCHREHGGDWALPNALASASPVTQSLQVHWLALMLLGALGGLVLLTHARAPVPPARPRAPAKDARAKELEAAPEACPGADRGYPKTLPLLIPTRCVGSAECVKVCPYDVLKMNAETKLPEIAKEELCHECGLCVTACNFGALKMWEVGKEPELEEVPEISADYETGLGDDEEGLYIIGHAAGLALVRNAANLGAWVVQHMVEERNIRRGMAARHGFDHELVVLGAGPGGLSTAIRAMEQGLDVLVLEAKPKPLWTIHTYGAKKKYEASPPQVGDIGPFELRTMLQPELLSELQQKISTQPPRIRFETLVAQGGIRRRDRGYVITTQTDEISALRVVLAIGGGLPRRLPKDVPVAPEADVRYTPIDAEPPTNADVVVYGAGNVALEVAAQLSETNRVTLIYRGFALEKASIGNRQRFEQLEAAGQLTFLRGTQPKALHNGQVDVITKPKDGGGEPVEASIPCQVFYCLIGPVPHKRWLESIGVKMTQRPITAEVGRTDRPQFLGRRG